MSDGEFVLISGNSIVVGVYGRFIDETMVESKRDSNVKRRIAAGG